MGTQIPGGGGGGGVVEGGGGCDGVWRGGAAGGLYLTLYCHHQNGCAVIKMG